MKPFELVYSDLWGATPISSITGVKYLLLFIYDYTCYTWLYLLNSKDDTFSHFLQFNNLIETQFNIKIMSLQTK